ncbi:interferon-related developmental regulator-domain-containing protein [Xylaria bambusicola]|uniref:interferon-related developmental regulator-domain-containing protein n=1 Tax=Xylaria bambusicola TaxID=326684 RepID=UPI00200862DA|nr:interferon-related developmental regulator-domain-containing protein [Xylaria bambusicola]KAI0521885.1 interferon-related developmental regulator-domain-containing protein [Xylaria bambusicola]
MLLVGTTIKALGGSIIGLPTRAIKEIGPPRLQNIQISFRILCSGCFQPSYRIYNPGSHFPATFAASRINTPHDLFSQFPSHLVSSKFESASWNSGCRSRQTRYADSIPDKRPDLQPIYYLCDYHPSFASSHTIDMRDLRKKILLESGKTVSRKARSRPDSLGASPIASPAASRTASRVNSRYASEEEDISDSEYEDSLTNSVANSDDGNEPIASWTDRLADRIAELLDRKRSSAKGREHCLSAYTHIIRHHYADEQLQPQLNELIPAILKSVRSGSNTDETLSAVKALTMTILTTQAESFYDHMYPSLKGLCQDSDEAAIKVEAIEAMSIATMCGGGSMVAAEELLDFLLEIVESDGHSVEAGDNGPVVSAALKAWGFVASNLDDLQEQSDQALEAFTEQLDSTDVDVQVSAGTNIALIFESVREYEDETEEASDLQYDQHKLMQRMTALVRESSKAVSKKDRKHLHASFNSVLTSLEHGKGPGYSTARRMASNPHTGGTKMDFGEEYREYGYREKIRIHNISMIIDTWSLSTRVEMLRSVLGAGLAIHYLENPAIKDILSAAQVEFVSTPGKGGRGDEYLSSPRKNRGGKASKGAGF